VTVHPLFDPVTRPWDCRVAVDLVRIVDVAGAVDRFGDRYLRRVYTDHELQTSGNVPGGSCGVGPNVGLATRFAAKSAMVKVLESSGIRPDLRSIEVLHHPEGAFGVSLIGETARAAAAMGIGRVSVRLSYASGVASAVAVAVCEEQQLGPRTEPAVGPATAANAFDAGDDEIRAVIDDQARLPVAAGELGDDDDLVAAGMTAHAGVNLLLALEEEFGVRFPDSAGQRGMLRSVGSIRMALRSMAAHETTDHADHAG
jgi:holo-[acyl-carrier protein] synthase